MIDITTKDLEQAIVEQTTICCDCGDEFVPTHDHQRRCSSCNAAKHMG